jgi:hypothetical protein
VRTPVSKNHGHLKCFQNLPENARLAETLLKSSKFRKWKPTRIAYKTGDHTQPALEKHFSPAELAGLWGVSVETIRSLFRNEPGVLKIGRQGTKYRRGYFTMKIPLEVVTRVHRRLSV